MNWIAIAAIIFGIVIIVALPTISFYFMIKALCPTTQEKENK